MQSGWLTCPRCRTRAEVLPERETEPDIVPAVEPVETKSASVESAETSSGFVPKASGSGVGFFLVVVVAGLLFALLGSLYN